uniref:Uncharacterized protein n=1 Tax=Oryza meridionalis TaxID=40149 RepID=A0A0E0CFS5_9ORYZ
MSAKVGEVHIAKIAAEVVSLESASTVRDAELLQKLLGICPVKLLLLAFIITRFFIISHVADGNCPVNELLEMFSTWRGRTGVEDGSSCISPLRWLKLMSRTVMLLDAINSSGKPPDSELWDRLRRSRLVRLPRDGEIRPSRPLEASETSVTVPSALQVTPSHWQQSAAFRHDTARPPSLERLERNWRRELLSCSVHELVGEARESNSSSAKARLNLRKSMKHLLLHFLHEEWSCCCFCMASKQMKLAGICPLKLLLLTLSATIFFITAHVDDGNCPANKLLEIFSICSGLAGVEDGNSLRSPSRRLKLTSTTMRLLEENNSCGRAPDSRRPGRLPRDGEMRPWRLLEARETSVTVLSWLQVIPSHLQQSVPSCHDAARPPS